MAAAAELMPVQSKKQVKRGGFRTFGEQLMAIRDAAISRVSSGGHIDPRLIGLQRRYTVAKGASEQVPSDGGFLVAPQFSRELVERMYSVGDILKRCTPMPITSPNSNAIAFPQIAETSRAVGSRMGGVRTFWEDEADAATKAAPKFFRTVLNAKKIIGLVYLTDELMADSGALESWALYAFSQEMAFKLENDFVVGSGAGKPLGIINSTAMITVPIEAGQGSKTVLAANVVNMISRLWPPSRSKAIWIYNPDLLPQLMELNIVVGGGGSIANLYQFASEEGWDRLVGLPAIPSEYCPAIGAVGDLLLVDFSRYAVAMREDIVSDVSIHVNFLTDESAFRFTMRVNGQPIDLAPITPLNSTTTQSPFLGLAARP